MANKNLFFHPAKKMLLDINKGIFRYDVDSDSMEFVLHMRKRERQALACLLVHENMPVSRNLLAVQAWAGRIVSDNAISVSIHILRKALVTIDPHCRCLVTVRNSGYIFSPAQSGLIAVESLDFLLDSLRWSSTPRTADVVVRDRASQSIPIM
ncbi:hypothetical protein D3C84_487880 [compost metagenome]